MASLLLPSSSASALSSSVSVPPGIYGFNGAAQLIRQFPNGSSTILSPALPAELQMQQLSTLDQNQAILYALGFNATSQASNLIGVSLQDGSLVCNVAVPFIEAGIAVGMGQQLAWDSVTGLLVAGGQLQQGGPHTVGYLDPSSGTFASFAEVNATYLPIIGAPSIFDPITASLVMPLGDPVTGEYDLFSVSTQTGSVQEWGEDFLTGTDIQSLAYDSSRGLILGTGLQPNGTNPATNASAWQRTLVELDPSSHSITTVGAVPGYLVESGATVALDEAAGVLYWIGQKTGAAVSDPLYLIGLDTQTAAIVSDPLLCVDQNACAWNLQYYRGSAAAAAAGGASLGVEKQ